MVADEIRKLLKERPFRAFRLNLADGRKIEVLHPDFLLVDPRGRTLNHSPTDDQRAAGDIGALVDAALVVSVDLEIVPSHGHGGGAADAA